MEVTWRPANELPIPDRLQELIEDRLEGLPAQTVEALEVVSALSAPTLDAIAAATDPSARSTIAWVRRSRTASSRSSATAFGSPTPSLRPPSIRGSRRLGVASCTRGSRRSSAIRRNEPATWPCPSRARTSPSPPPSRRPPLLAFSRGAPQSAAELWEMARRATPPDRGEDLVRRTHQAGVAHYECGDTSLARSVLEQAVDLSMAGPARARVLLDLGMALAENEGWRGAWAVFEAARGEAGDDLALQGTDRAEPRVRLAVPGRPRGIGTARSRSAAAGRGAAGTTGDGRGVPGVSIRRVPPRTRGRSGAARSRDRPGRAHGGRIQIPRPACELRRGSAPQVHRSPGRGPADVHRAPG